MPPWRHILSGPNCAYKFSCSRIAFFGPLQNSRRCHCLGRAHCLLRLMYKNTVAFFVTPGLMGIAISISVISHSCKAPLYNHNQQSSIQCFQLSTFSSPLSIFSMLPALHQNKLCNHCREGRQNHRRSKPVCGCILFNSSIVNCTSTSPIGFFQSYPFL